MSRSGFLILCCACALVWPLAGVHAALTYLADQNLNGSELYTVPVDCPFYPMDLVQRLDQRIHFSSIWPPINAATAKAKATDKPT